jgi:hypothetical protein
MQKDRGVCGAAVRPHVRIESGSGCRAVLHRGLVIVIGSLHLRRPAVILPHLSLRVDGGLNGLRPGFELVCKRSDAVELTADNVGERV